VPIWGPGDIQAEPERIGSNGSPTQVYRTWEPTRKITSQMLEGTPQQQARALLEKLGQVQ